MTARWSDREVGGEAVGEEEQESEEQRLRRSCCPLETEKEQMKTESVRVNVTQPVT